MCVLLGWEIKCSQMSLFWLSAVKIKSSPKLSVGKKSWKNFILFHYELFSFLNLYEYILRNTYVKEIINPSKKYWHFAKRCARKYFYSMFPNALSILKTCSSFQLFLKIWWQCLSLAYGTCSQKHTEKNVMRNFDITFESQCLLFCFFCVFVFRHTLYIISNE